MASIRIDHVPQEIYDRLQRRAEQHHRSLEQEALNVLAENAVAREEDPRQLLKEIDELRESLNVPPVTDEFIRNARLKSQL